MTFIEDIKTWLFILFNANKIYFSLIEADLAINGSIRGHQATSIDKSKTKFESSWYSHFNSSEFWLTGHVRYFNGDIATIHYNLAYRMPKEYILTYKQYILYVMLKGKITL